jgi:hypothetical protein
MTSKITSIKDIQSLFKSFNEPESPPPIKSEKGYYYCKDDSKTKVKKALPSANK